MTESTGHDPWLDEVLGLAGQGEMVSQDGTPSASEPIDITGPSLVVDLHLPPARGSRWRGQNMLEENARNAPDEQQEQERGHG